MPAICKYQETIKEIEMTEGNTDTINDRKSLTTDDERQYDITLRAISKMDETTRNCEYLMSLAMIKRITTILEENSTLHNALAVKEIADKLLSYACEGAHATICEGHTDDRDYCSKSMMDLIMILIREYGGAISSKMLYQFLDRCDYEYDKALQTIIDTGLLECSIRDDGDIACFYIP